MWRQRLGYYDDWLLTTRQQRRNILHRLLIAMWNGQIDVLSGTDEKPSEIEFRASAYSDPGDDVLRLRLRLEPFGPTSPWGSLLHAYEEATLRSDKLEEREAFRLLMNVTPTEYNDDTDHLAERVSVYRAFRKVAPKEMTRLAELRDKLRDRTQSTAARLQVRRLEGLLEFWGETVPEALHQEFDPVQNSFFNTLMDLESSTQDG
jgi:hypothetical protein